MTFTIKLKTIEDIKRFRTKIKSMELQFIQFNATTLRRLANEIITAKIHENMRRADFSEKIIDGTFLDNIELTSKSKTRLYFRSEYYADSGFDVAVAREDGTDDHDVVAGPGKSLPIPTPQGIIFRKKSHPSGIPALHIVSDTTKNLKPSLQTDFDREKKTWIQKNLGVGNQ